MKEGTRPCLLSDDSPKFHGHTRRGSFVASKRISRRREAKHDWIESINTKVALVKKALQYMQVIGRERAVKGHYWF